MCYILSKRETSYNFFSDLFLGNAEHYNGSKQINVSVAIPDCLFFPFEVYYAWHFNDSS